MFHRSRLLNLALKVLFLLADLIWVRKDRNLWVMAIPATDRFDGNVRALYELVREDPTLCAPAQIKVIVSPRDAGAVAPAHRVRWGSLEHFLVLLRAGCILYHHNYNDVGLIALPLWRCNVRVSHGIHFKCVERAQSVPDFLLRVLLSTRNMIPHHFVSSKLDAMSAVVYFHLYLPDIMITGAAKNDLLINRRLPDGYRHQEERLQNRLGGRRLITYAPTWRVNGASYRFTSGEASELRAFLERENAVFGIAGHAYLKERHIPNDARFIDLNALDIDIQVVLRNTDILIHRVIEQPKFDGLTRMLVAIQVGA